MSQELYKSDNIQDIILPTNKSVLDITDSHVPIHLLHTQAYCEHQIFLEYVKGIEVEPTTEMLKGIEKHDSLDEEHREKAKVELSINEALIKSATERIALISRDIYVQGAATYGRIDEIIIEPSRIIVVDDKPTPVPYFTNKVQVWGYCHTFKEMYEPELPLVGALRHEDTGEITWLEEFSEEHAIRVTDGVKRIQAILSQQSQGEPTSNKRKCTSCRLRLQCDVSTRRE